MRNRAQSILFSSIAIAGVSMFGPSPAHAELNACGGIFLTGDAACQYRPTEECMTQCMTVAVEQPCVAQVYNECETTCTSSASVECESSCTSSCVNNCTTTTTTDNAPTCMELCLTDCDDGSDDHYCGSAQHKGACGRCEKHNCSKKCEQKCGDAEAPKKITTVTECMPTCTNACSASCTAKANTECQVTCQERTYQECETKMVEQCKTECKQTGGAIFCDGQFVNATNANSCADELRAKVKIDIDIKGSISATGAAVSDVGKKIDKACTVANVGAGRGDGWLGVLCSIAGLALCRVYRRRTRR
jgi:hypothetical protein